MKKQMAKYICNACEMGGGFEGNCANGNSYETCAICNETADALYKAGYRDVKILVDEIFSEITKLILLSDESDGYLTHHAHIPSLLDRLNRLATKYKSSFIAKGECPTSSEIDLKATTFDIVQSLEGRGNSPLETGGVFAVKRLSDGRERCVEVYNALNGQKLQYGIHIYYEDGEDGYEYVERDSFSLFRALVEISVRKEEA